MKQLVVALALLVVAAAQHGPPLAPPPHPGPVPLAPGPVGHSGPGGQGGPGGAKEGGFFTNEAIRQAQNSYLIPKDATIQKVQEGMEVAAYEGIPGDQRINLFEILGAHVPPEVVNNLQQQVDQVGRQ